MKTLTQKRLKELLYYDPETGNFTYKKPWFNRKIGDIASLKHSTGHTRIRLDGCLYYSHRLAWLYIYGYFPENEIDHINRNKSDNRICNLREVSVSCNMRNTGNRSNNTSGVKGVYWFKQKSKWCSYIIISSKKYFLGLYSSFDEAVCTRLAAEQCLNWSNCNTNSPAFQYVQKMLNRA